MLISAYIKVKELVIIIINIWRDKERQRACMCACECVYIGMNRPKLHTWGTGIQFTWNTYRIPSPWEHQGRCIRKCHAYRPSYASHHATNATNASTCRHCADYKQEHSQKLRSKRVWNEFHPIQLSPSCGTLEVMLFVRAARGDGRRYWVKRSCFAKPAMAVVRV